MLLTGIHLSNIAGNCNKKRFSAGSYIWLFEIEYHNKNFELNNILLKMPKIKAESNQETKKRNNFKNNPVLQLNIDGSFVKEWAYPSQAKNDGFNPDKIFECLRGKNKTHKKFIWQYKTNQTLITK